jgi:hypothetical protein
MAEPVTGRQHHERVLDGAYVLLTWTYDHPDLPDAMALLSSESMCYFDVRGITRVFDPQIDEAGWSSAPWIPSSPSATPPGSVVPTPWIQEGGTRVIVARRGSTTSR